MNREKHQADALHIVDDSMSFDEIPKKTCRFITWYETFKSFLGQIFHHHHLLIIQFHHMF